MSSSPSSYVASLFYSYSHQDSQHRDAMERSLSVLKAEGLLHDWSDKSVLPGQSISGTIDPQLDSADIVAFLLSPDFLASQACTGEWDRAKNRSSGQDPLFRIPIVVRPCDWQQFLGDDDLLALPYDGQPVVSFTDTDEAWLQITEGIRSVAN
ncbi:toll/interleukin-1 receptor domain-containing protein [Candidatus Poribacteria bacterium]|nr:toll/interleukin-1 receptor domain-containing protein [Candidatus Poribacteria bacterium]MYF22707.1 toll/interleukin-1 receptor domain-containing protein [Chloroflexota bacterium]